MKVFNANITQQTSDYLNNNLKDVGSVKIANQNEESLWLYKFLTMKMIYKY